MARFSQVGKESNITSQNIRESIDSVVKCAEKDLTPKVCLKSMLRTTRCTCKVALVANAVFTLMLLLAPN